MVELLKYRFAQLPLADVMVDFVDPDSQSLPPLTPVEHVRQRPAMYVGGVNRRALYRMVDELVDNAVDEVVALNGDTVWVTLHDDHTLSVSDNGRGIPVTPYGSTGVSTLEWIAARPGGVGQFDGAAHRFSGSLHGVGLLVVNALSEMLRIEVRRDGYVWEQRYRAGIPQGEVAQVHALSNGQPTGTTITFTPDFSVLERHRFDETLLARRLRELAFLNSGATFVLHDERLHAGGENVFRYPQGLIDFVKHLNRDRQTIHPPVYTKRSVNMTTESGLTLEMQVDLAFQYVESFSTIQLSYVNSLETPGGGTHLDGMNMAIASLISRHAYEQKLIEHYTDFTGGDINQGLTAVVAIRHPYPQLESLSRPRLTNPGVDDAVFKVTLDAFDEFARAMPEDMRRITARCLFNKSTREARRYGS